MNGDLHPRDISITIVCLQPATMVFGNGARDIQAQPRFGRSSLDGRVLVMDMAVIVTCDY